MRVRFWASASGKEPVRDWLDSQTRRVQLALAADLRTLQLGWPIGMPLARKMAPGLWELRTRADGIALRVLFTVRGETIVLLHGFAKPSAKTPRRALAVAESRMRQLED